MSLFSPITLKSVSFRNRIIVSPMCQYSSVNGLPNEWHHTHLGSRAVGGAALVIVEATAVTPEGRITPEDMGLWSDAHTQAFLSLTRFIKSHGAVPGIQLAHAGRKASTYVPWKGEGSLKQADGAWATMAPSAVAFQEGWQVPKAMNEVEIKKTAADFGKAARRAFEAGFEFVEIHSAHGYLLNEFLSPLANQRNDAYGGSFDNRIRFPLETVTAVRQNWPENLPLAIRLSCADWVEGGWTPEESVEFARRVKALDVDLLDCSSGGMVPTAKIPVGPGYQVPFSEKIKREAGIGTIAVGMITEPQQADLIIREGKADFVALARAFLRDPYWALNAAHALGVDVPWPVQYLRAKPKP